MGAYLSSLFTHVDGRGRDGAGVSVRTLWGVRGLASVQLLPCQTSLLGHEELHLLPAAVTVNTNKIRQALITNPTAATVNTNKLTQALITNSTAATVNTNKLTQALITSPAAATVDTNKLTQALIGRKPRACERWPCS